MLRERYTSASSSDDADSVPVYARVRIAGMALSSSTENYLKFFHTVIIKHPTYGLDRMKRYAAS